MERRFAEQLPPGVEPTDLDEQVAYDLLVPAPYTMSPLLFVSRTIAFARERVLEGFESVAQELPPEAAAKVRAQIERARGRL